MCDIRTDMYLWTFVGKVCMRLRNCGLDWTFMS